MRNKPKLSKPLLNLSRPDDQRPVTSNADVGYIRPLLVSRGQAARILNISERSLHFLIAHGEVKVRRIGSRVLVVVASLEAYTDVDHPDRLAHIRNTNVMPGDDDPEAA